MTSPATAQRLRALALFRRVRDRIDREYTQPLDVEALARGVQSPRRSSAIARSMRRVIRYEYGDSP